jgi:hypothetical protein
MDKCSLCSQTNFMNQAVCQDCYLTAKMESHKAMWGYGKFDTIDYEIQNVKEELRQIRELLNELLPKKKEIKSVTKDLW